MTDHDLVYIRTMFEVTGLLSQDEIRSLLDEVIALWNLRGIQRILADCREESSAWHDGYRTAVKDMEEVQLALRAACNELLEHNATSNTTSAKDLESWRSLSDRLFTPENSLARQRAIPL